MNDNVYDTLKIVLPFEDGGTFPTRNTGRGEDISPKITIENLSRSAVSLAVTLEDISHPVKNFTHWVIWNIPADSVIKGGIKPGKLLPDGSVQGIGYGMHRYAGPKPPKGTTHSYRLTVYSLDCMLNMSAVSFKGNFLKNVRGHILQKGCVTGKFE